MTRPASETFGERAERLSLSVLEASDQIDRLVIDGAASVSGYAHDGSTPLDHYVVTYHDDPCNSIEEVSR